MDLHFSVTYLLGGVLVPPVSLVIAALLGLLLLKRRRTLGLVICTTSLVGLLLLSTPYVAFSLMGRLEPPPLPNSRALAGTQAIVILAGGVHRGAVEWGGDTINNFTLERVRYGARLARETRLPVLITGAAPSDGRPGEAAMMRDVLLAEFGVPVRWVEDGSRHTGDNGRRSAAMLKADGIQRVALVTSAFHLPRAQRAFERAGLQVVAAGTGYQGYSDAPPDWTHFVPNGSALRTSFFALREMAANLLYLVTDR